VGERSGLGVPRFDVRLPSVSVGAQAVLAVVLLLFESARTCDWLEAFDPEYGAWNRATSRLVCISLSSLPEIYTEAGLGTIVPQMPENQITIKAAKISDALERLLGGGAVATGKTACHVYGSDGTVGYAGSPLAVVLPRTVQELADVVRCCSAMDVKVYPRGAGTSLCGGAIPGADGIVICLSKLTRVLECDFESRTIRVEAGASSRQIFQAAAGKGLSFAPDPASGLVSTLGGNVANNAVGALALRDGATSAHVTGMKLVRADGETVDLGGDHFDAAGYDLTGLVVGAEGQLGIVAEVTLRLTPDPEGRSLIAFGFAHVTAAAQCLGGLVGSGILPAGAALLDKQAMAAGAAFSGASFPPEADGVLILELSGSEDECAAMQAWMNEIAAPFAPMFALAVDDEDEQLRLRAARDAVFAALGRYGRFRCVDGVVALSRLPGLLARVSEIASGHGIEVANVVPSGDGHLCSFVLFDADVPGALEQAERAAAEILAACVSAGGTLTGAHGIGIGKRDLMPLQFSEEDLDLQTRIKAAFDPAWLFNPGKVFPVPGASDREAEPALDRSERSIA
jgi:glycolate oxidase